MINKHEVKGKAENLKGRVKEAAGVVSGNKEHELKGGAERTAGATMEKLGQAKRELKNLHEANKK
jgi:uncharacterized protein YjbJ (UPF0337 family)